MCFLRPCAICGDTRAWTHLVLSSCIEEASCSYCCTKCLRQKRWACTNGWCHNQWCALGFHTSPPTLMPSSSAALRAWLYARRLIVQHPCCRCGAQEAHGLCHTGGLQPFAYCCKGCIRFIIGSWSVAGDRATAFDFVVVCRSRHHYTVYGAGAVDLLYWLVNDEEWFRQVLIAGEAAQEPASSQ